MKRRRRERSTARDPFSAFREIGPRLTVYDDVLEETPWHSPPAADFEVDWIAFLAGAKPELELELLEEAVAAFSDKSDLPIASLLVGYTASFFDFQSQAAAAPTLDEIQNQLRSLREALRRLGSLAQGSDGSGPMNPGPEWFIRQDEDPSRRQAEEFIRQQNNRTPALHPMLQDHILMVYAAGINELPEPERDAALRKLDEQQKALVDFFDRVPHIIKAVKMAESQCGELSKALGITRAVGAPKDKARAWALVRLMWIWRDVFEEEVRIYVRKTRARVALEQPEPKGCMAFVCDALRSFSPVEAHELASLERRLLSLREKIPAARLVRSRSRGN